MAELLRSAADYFDKGSYIDEDGYYYIHPNEVKREPKVSKRNYNKLARLYKLEEFIPKRKNQKKKPMIEFPKSGKLTKGLKEMFDRFGINPYN